MRRSLPSAWSKKAGWTVDRGAWENESPMHCMPFGIRVLSVLQRYRSMTGTRRNPSGWRGLLEIALLFMFINRDLALYLNPISGIRWPNLEGLRRSRMAQSQGLLRTDAAVESCKPQKAERGESKRPKLLTRARFSQNGMTRPRCRITISYPRLASCKIVFATVTTSLG